MKVCFIGNCGHSKKAYATLMGRADVAICGFAPGSTYERADKAPDASIPRYESYTEMLDAEQPDLAVVSPVFGRTGEVILACAARGVDVFSEKPVAASLEELERVECAVRESGIRFCAMHYLRFAPAFYHAAHLVREGAIGEVKLLTAQKSYQFGTRPAWYGNRSLYGGTIPWVGIHAIDWIYHFSGKRFRSVTAQSVGSPEMAALCQFEMEDGVMASVNIDYYRPASAPTHGDDRIRCVGTKGVLEVRNKRIYLINENGEQEILPSAAPELFSKFLDGRQPISVDEIFYLTRVALTAREAADRKTTLQIKE
ncbi:MAG: Gfo/Idh/MocA family oxidoreductase [Clostridia bacterium]|nr:Gfo/Idh/MocA family oxidoreductase [Clostridia bacterium]